MPGLAKMVAQLAMAIAVVTAAGAAGAVMAPRIDPHGLPPNAIIEDPTDPFAGIPIPAEETAPPLIRLPAPFCINRDGGLPSDQPAEG